ncbi:hypothetical protein [Asticcacaulis sp. BE141]|uniref:hypothetical protein n=1 Tax=Asticcacaulis sp. BE141 TaxID=2817848 RepID=UPI0028575C59|nr:hypothetical protein [Asticcacaulis sp. BE141]MBP2158855.1 hypothetical protein [Asticcacaulis solisilvae]MDR6799900.1 hypothetical protein [Asticcacaulis sp. BE141]
MKIPSFLKLNRDWNADPNAPEPGVAVTSGTLRLSFYLNDMAYRAEERQRGQLTFLDCQVWRLGATNDEGWYYGQCRYSRLAPAWGEFYEVMDGDPLCGPTDWRQIGGAGRRHFLFYFKDGTFECLAADWSFSRIAAT